MEQIGEERGEHHVHLTLQRTQSSGEPTDLTTLTVFQYQYWGILLNKTVNLKIKVYLFVNHRRRAYLTD